MKIKDLVGDLSYEEIKARKWWKCKTSSLAGKKHVLDNYAISDRDEVMRITLSKNYQSYLGKILYDGHNSSIPYLAMNLCLSNGGKVRVRIHRLKWESRKGFLKKGYEINHKNGINGVMIYLI